MVTEKDLQLHGGGGPDPTRVLVRLPCDLEIWPLVQGALGHLCRPSSLDDLTHILDHVHALIHGNIPLADGGQRGRASAVAGLVHFVREILTEEERREFLRVLLPTIVNLALAIGDLKPREDFYYSVQQRGGETRLSRRFVASIVAHQFLCTLPNAPGLSLNQNDFQEFFFLLKHCKAEDSQTAKLRCVLHYFRRIATSTQANIPLGHMTFTRKVMTRDEMPVLETWTDSRLQLCPIVVRPEGKIEDAGSSTLQVDFANEYIGGGVLGSGCVQEEIRFVVCPELLASLVFMESMEDNEAITISGFEQFSAYTGYGWNLRYAGDFRDSAQISIRGDIKTSLVAIDATPMGEAQFKGTPYQFTGPALLRELNKAYIGFLQSSYLTSDVNGGELSESVYLDAVDQSQVSTETDFETASEGLDSLQRPATTCFSTITEYSNSLSRAITDIAVMDYCQSQRIHHPQSESGTTLQGGGTQSDVGCQSGGLSTFASSIAGGIVKDGFQQVKSSAHESVVSAPGAKTKGRHRVKGCVTDLAENLSSSLMADVMDSAKGCGGDSSQGDAPFVVCRGGTSCPDGDGDGISQSLGAIIDDIVSVVIKEALAEIAGTCVSETDSVRGPSLEGYSVISSWSTKSDSFVKLDLDSDFSGTRSAGSLSSLGSERVGMTVEAYVSGVVAGAVQKMKDGASSVDSHRTLGDSTKSTQSSDVENIAHEIVQGAVRGAKMKCQLTEEHRVNNSYFRPVVSAGLDEYASNVADAAFKDAMREISSPMQQSDYQYSRYSTIPSTPPPSPSNASTGSSKRFSLEDPSQLEEFAEKLLSSITPDPNPQRHERSRGSEGDIPFQRFQDIEEFASSLVSKAVTDSAQIVSSCSPGRRESSSGCVSSRSSLTVPSGSSKRSSVDSFTEDLLKIGNIDPTGRRPSKTEENIAYFSQELARVAEVEEKLGQRRKSDLEDFQQELYQSTVSNSGGQKQDVTQSKVHAAARLANRLSDDIICDAFLQLYGATPFRELIRLDSLSDLESGGGNRRRSYPRRGFRTSSVSSASLSVRSTISEVDLVTMASNLANTIIESAMQTYRDEYLAAQQMANLESIPDDTSSHFQDTMDGISVLATYDGSNMDHQETACTSLAGELPELSIQETAGCIVERAVQDAVTLYRASSTSPDGVCHSVGGVPKRPIATGNWGCGVFGGDPQLKSLLQWMAASQCRAPSVFYYTFNDHRALQLEQVTLKIQTRRWSVGDLMRIILEYSGAGGGISSGSEGLFDFILGLPC